MVAWINCACGVNRLPASYATTSKSTAVNDHACPACKRIAELEAENARLCIHGSDADEAVNAALDAALDDMRAQRDHHRADLGKARSEIASLRRIVEVERKTQRALDDRLREIRELATEL